MFDFKLNDVGDFILSSTDNTSSLKVSIFLPDKNNFPAQRVSIFTGSQKNIFNKSINGQKVSFKKSLLTAYDTKNNILQNLEEVAQNITLQLKSELNGSLSSEIGSTFYKYKHLAIITEQNLEEIATAAQQVVNEIIEGATVQVEQVIDDRIPFFSTQTIKITVFYNDDVLTEYFI